jgi:hypothetical protein
MENKENINSAPKTVTNFKAITEVENFYRFVYEHKLRREAKMMLEGIVKTVSVKRKRRSRARTLQ